VFLVGVGEDVGALQRLVKKAENVVNDEDALLCVLGAGGVWSCGLAEDLGEKVVSVHVFRPSTVM
jgi:hypothetical protein